MSTPRQKEFVSGSGKKYMFQHPGALSFIRMKKRCDNGQGKGVADEEKLQNEIMTHVIVQPKTNWEYWDENLEDHEEVMKAALSFLRGKDKQEGSEI